MNSYEHQLFINLNFPDLKNFPFPIDPTYKDTLSNTAFNFDFYCEGKIISSDYNKIHNSDPEADTTESAGQLSIVTDTMDLKASGLISLQIPLYAFHELKSGKHMIELHMYQTTFTDELRNDSGYVNLSAKRSLFDARLKFELEIPDIYKTMVYGYGLELRNDSTFTPAGMDNTIWNSSYPDIYWMLYYPENTLYTKTDYEKSTDRYEGRDTISLYHYYENDSIAFSVFDHDNLSADDCLGYTKPIPLRTLYKHKIARVKFDYVKSFDVKLLKKGKIN